MEGVILRSNIPMKEILQYSDKLKIDKFLLGVKLEDENKIWSEIRSAKTKEKRIH